jgi:hypothetical protein
VLLVASIPMIVLLPEFGIPALPVAFRLTGSIASHDRSAWQS